MDFGRVYDEIGGFLVPRGFRHAVVGGLALAAYGHPRTTLDLDVVTEGRAQDAIIEFMEGLGYATLHRSTGYSNHGHPDGRLGRVDFVYVHGETVERLFAGVRTMPGPVGRVIPVPRPEHLAAMKVQAIKNAPERTWQEMADISYLVSLEGVDRNEIRGYFAKAGLLERWHELERTL